MRIQYMISFIPNWRLYNLLLFASLPHRQMVSWECVLNIRFVCALVDRSSGQKKPLKPEGLRGSLEKRFHGYILRGFPSDMTAKTFPFFISGKMFSAGA